MFWFFSNSFCSSIFIKFYHSISLGIFNLIRKNCCTIISTFCRQQFISKTFSIKNICKKLDRIKPKKNKRKYETLITYVDDRPGHDLRYSLNSGKIKKEINWVPKTNLDRGLELTIKWYLENEDWWKTIRKFKYKGERLGKRR